MIKVIEFSDRTVHYRNGKIHRDGDEPAIEYKDGTKEWYKNGKVHRDNDLPAITYKDGSKHWFKNGKLHRDGDRPAIIYDAATRGYEYWYKNGKLHRDGDKPAVVDEDKLEYFVNGKFHRTGNLPAKISKNGAKDYYVNGKLHRLDGPAHTHVHNTYGIVIEWYKNGKRHCLSGPSYKSPSGFNYYHINGERFDINDYHLYLYCHKLLKIKHDGDSFYFKYPKNR